MFLINYSRKRNQKTLKVPLFFQHPPAPEILKQPDYQRINPGYPQFVNTCF